MERRIRHFISLLDFGGEIVYVDESYSSAEALERLKSLGKKERSEKIKNGELDSLSALIILERYLSEYFLSQSGNFSPIISILFFR